MERIAPAGDVYQAGTLSGNPLAVAAALATLELLDEPPTPAGGHDRQARRGASGRGRGRRDRPVRVQSVPGLLTAVLQRPRRR